LRKAGPEEFERLHPMGLEVPLGLGL
jgi:hypothetical protein